MKLKLLLRFKLFFLLIIATSVSVFSQGSTYRIFFKDKGNESFTKGSLLYEKTYNSLSAKAIERRLKILSEDNIISFEDAELYQPYLNEIEKLGGKILAKVKWENYCVAYIDDESMLNQISELDFIKFIQETSSEFQTLTINSEHKNLKKQENTLLNIISVENADSLSNKYGATYNFSNMLKVPEVHSLGISGDGVLIGFLDSGFRHKALSALQIIKILSEFDFIYRDSITANQKFDHPLQDFHGSQVLSIAVGNQPQKYLGVAPSATVALAKTENLHYERKIEEDWFYEGVEWLESKGVDIINASLGYATFDSLQTSYIFSDLTGKKAITTRAVNNAAKRGVLFVVAAGNGGPEPETINTPADADSVLSVGSVNADRTISRFSARGGDALGRKRPHLSAQGGEMLIVNPGNDSILVEGGGTSLSSPVISGSSALLLSAFPELTPFEMKQILYRSADKYPNQNNETGYGIPDLYKAIMSYDIVISPPLFTNIHHFQRVTSKISFYEPVSEVVLFVKYSNSQTFEEYPMRYFSDGYFYADLPLNKFITDTAFGYITAKSGLKNRRMPYKENSTFPILKYNEHIPFGLKMPDFGTEFVENAGSFVFPSTAPRFTDKINIVTYSDNGYSLKIFVNDVLGKQVFSQEIENQGIGVIDREIPVSDLISGIYFVNIISSGRNESIKFIIY